MTAKDPADSHETDSPLSPKLISRKIKLVALVISLFLFYAVGLFIRSSHGIRVTVRNESGKNLKNADLMLDRGDSYLIGDIAVGTTRNIFVAPGTKSSIRLEFADAEGQKHSEIVAGYVENGYCGDVTVRVLPNLNLRSRDESFALLNWKSWYGFL
jgi:hypothetical protein